MMVCSAGRCRSGVASRMMGVAVLVVMLLLAGAPASPVYAEGLRTLVNFSGTGTIGKNVIGDLTLVGSKLYGVTSNGGSNNGGTVFSVNTDGTGLQTLVNFAAGSDLKAGLTLVGSKFYGTTRAGGAPGKGTLFSLNTDGTGFQTRYTFSTIGQKPCGELTLSGSNLWGTTESGGASNNGTIFSWDTGGGGMSFAQSFSGGSGGAVPEEGMTLVGSRLYGTTAAGGSSSQGTVFSVNADGTDLRILVRFNGTNGVNPQSDLTFDGARLYGTTMQGGSSGLGTVFSVNTDGTDLQTLVNFTDANGRYPEGGMTLVGSRLYGTTTSGGTSNKGTLFSVDTDGTDFQTLVNFNGANGSAVSWYSDMLLSENTLYGVTYAGGTSNYGTIFAYDLPAPDPLPEPPTVLVLMACVVGFVGVRSFRWVTRLRA